MARLHYVKVGRGPVVVLSHALGCHLGMWDEVTALLQERYTVLRYDQRGHGQSERPSTPYSIDDMADDAATLIREVAPGPVHFAGLSLGGMVAQALAVRHPTLLKSIVIANSAGYYDEAARTMWQARVQTVRTQGMAAIAEGALQRWFTPEFRADTQRGAARVQALRGELEQCDAVAYAASCTAVAGIDFRASNPRIACPTLVITGERDEATPPAMSQAIAAAIPGARLATLQAAHLSAVEQPDAFAALLDDFWQAH